MLEYVVLRLGWKRSPNPLSFPSDDSSVEVQFLPDHQPYNSRWMYHVRQKHKAVVLMAQQGAMVVRS